MAWEMKSVSWPRNTTGSSAGPWGSGRKLAREVYSEYVDVDGTQNSGLTAFAYCWRRFGPPIIGSDDHKSLADYLLTTPRHDVWLWLHTSGSAIDLCVGAIMERRVEAQILQPVRDWVARRNNWLEREYIRQHPELKPLVKKWRWVRKAKKVEMKKAFWDWKHEHDSVEDRIDELRRKDALTAEEEAERRKLSRGFKRFQVPMPPKDDETAAAKRVQNAIRAALKDLLRPVFIRDVPINVFGRMTDDAARKMKKCQVSKYAGFGVDVSSMDECLKAKP